MGNYSDFVIGRVTKVIEDTTREEKYEGNRKLRSFPVSIFYPTLESLTEGCKTNLTSLFEPASQEAIDTFSNFVEINGSGLPVENFQS